MTTGTPDSTAAATTATTDLELDALRASITSDLPAYLEDLARLVNIDCGSYTPDGVNEIGRWTAKNPILFIGCACAPGKLSSEKTSLESDVRGLETVKKTGGCRL